MEKQHVVLDISWESIFRVGVVVAAVAGLFYFGSFLWWIWAGIIIATLANVPINFLEKYRIPRFLGAMVVYILGVAGIVLLAALFIPSLVSELKQFTLLIPAAFSDLIPRLPLQLLEGEALTFDRLIAGEDIRTAVTQLAGLGIKLFGGFAAFAFIISVALFLSLEKRGMEKFLEFVFPPSSREVAVRVWRRGERRIVGWFGVRAIGAIFVGIATLIGLLLLGAPYPFLFAILAGLFDFIPFVGPVLIGIIMVVVAAIDSLLLGGLVGILVIIVQQLEGSIVLPLISKRMMGMHPIYVLIVVFVGFKLGGGLGMILALPLGAMLLEVFREIGTLRSATKPQGEAQ